MDSNAWGIAVSILSILAILAFVFGLLRKAISQDQRIKDLEYEAEKKRMRDESKEMSIDSVIERVLKHINRK